MEKTLTREFDYAYVEMVMARRTPSGCDDWAITINPKDGGEPVHKHILGGLFDHWETIAEYAYREWMKENI